MTPKEKAKELIDKYAKYLTDNDAHCALDIEKDLALIAVDEILNNDGFTQFDQYLTEYWNEVKKEIENL